MRKKHKWLLELLVFLSLWSVVALTFGFFYATLNKSNALGTLLFSMVLYPVSVSLTRIILRKIEVVDLAE